MKVWINKREGSYSGGMIVVAANSAEEAHGVMFKYCDSFTCEQYGIANWHECKGLDANVDNPILIEEAGYTD